MRRLRSARRPLEEPCRLGVAHAGTVPQATHGKPEARCRADEEPGTIKKRGGAVVLVLGRR